MMVVSEPFRTLRNGKPSDKLAVYVRCKCGGVFAVRIDVSRVVEVRS